MKKLINSPDTVVTDALRGMAAAHPELVGGCGIPRGILTDRHVQDAWGDHSDPDHNRKTSFVDHGTGRPDTVGTGRL